jgi:hypothetical protein
VKGEDVRPQSIGMQNGQTKAVWLLIAREGGRWSVREVTDTLGDDFDSVSQGLHRMAQLGCLTHYPRTTQRNRVTFGVTAQCKVPQGVTLADLLAIGVLKVAA